MPDAPPHKPTTSAPTRGQIVAIISGNALEFYDFLAFSFFAINIGRVMFPVDAPGVSLLLAMVTGAFGFLMRPVGAILFGILGDRLGRRPTMLATFLLMGAGALGLALTPSYAQIGIAAPVLVVVFRLIQGLAAGGDVGPTTAYLVECTRPERRGLFSSLQLSAMRTGALLSGLVGLSLASALTPAALDSYGWRVAFAIGGLIVPFAFLLRRRLEETLHLPEPDPHAPAKLQPRLCAAALIGMLGSLSASSTGDFLYPFAVTFLKVAPRDAYLMVMLLGVLSATLLALGGTLSDRVGRRPIRIYAGAIGAMGAVPLFAWLSAAPSFERLLCVALTLGVALAICGAASYAALLDLTPKHSRSRLVGIGYGVAVAVAFGATPPLATWWLNATGDLRIPGVFYAIGFALMLLSGVLLPETAPRKQGPASRS